MYWNSKNRKKIRVNKQGKKFTKLQKCQKNIQVFILCVDMLNVKSFIGV